MNQFCIGLIVGVIGMIAFNAIERHRRRSIRQAHRTELIRDLHSYADCIVRQYELEKAFQVNRIDRDTPLTPLQREKLYRIADRISELVQSIMERLG